MATPTPSNSPAITVDFRGVSFQTPAGALLVSDLNLAIHQGETLVLLGESGSGKTTTLKLINRLLEPTRGEVLVDGRPTTAWDPIRLRRSIGYVIQDIGLMPHFSVARNVGLVPMLEGWDAERILARTSELLGMVGLDPTAFAHRRPHELSGGQRQRVGVARALAADPHILLMDEPFGALDPVTRAELQREFRELKKKLRKTIVFVTHDLREGLMLADRIGLMAGGKLIAVLPPADFLRAEHPEIKSIVAVYRARTEFDA
ncbi:MAG: ATP-binding cassette domain-containing protein [Acidobacteria bacterium]|nr:ATP-binding cassette domain-containing protein [Acidobacteriota bacterium]